MKIVGIALALAVLVGCRSATQLGTQALPDAKRIEGEWTVVSAKHNGKRRVADRFVFEQGNATLHFKGGDSQTLSVRLRPSCDPKEIDLASPDEPERLLEYGIYELKDDSTLVICLTPAWAPSGPVAVRPKQFEKKDFFGYRLLKLNRVNVEKK